MAKKIPPPANIPNNMLMVIATLDNPYKKANTNPISKIVRFNRLGIICSL